MVRRRTARDRWRDRGRKRPKTPAPKTGWLVSELARLTGVKPRTITHYVSSGILPSPEFRGTLTRYQRPHLLCLLAAKQLKADGLSKLSAIRERVSAWGLVEVERYLRARPYSPEVASALGWKPSPTSADPTPSPAVGLTGESWRHIALLPGLELLVRDDVSPVVRELANRVCAQFRAQAG